MCLTPLRIKNPRYTGVPPDQWYSLYPEFKPDLGVLPLDYWIEVPCGKCLDCLKSKRSGWIFRLRQEYSKSKQGLFVTLTFSDEYYCKFFPSKEYNNKPLTLFLDRLRKKHGRSFRHFFIGEFGGETQRFHYHGILFNITFYDIEEFNAIWKYGYAWLGYCNDKTISYITKYILKENQDDVKIPRILASPGLGASYIDTDEFRHIKERPNSDYLIKTRKHPIAIPRYLLQKGLSEKERREKFRKYLLDYNRVVFIGGERYIKNTIEEWKAKEALLEIRNIQGFKILKQKNKSKLLETYGEYKNSERLQTTYK